MINKPRPPSWVHEDRKVRSGSHVQKEDKVGMGQRFSDQEQNFAASMHVSKELLLSLYHLQSTLDILGRR